MNRQNLEKNLKKLEAQKDKLLAKKNEAKELADKKIEELVNKLKADYAAKADLFDKELETLDAEIAKYRKAVKLYAKAEESLADLFAEDKPAKKEPVKVEKVEVASEPVKEEKVEQIELL